MGTSNYSDEFKRDAVHQITVRGYPVREVSRRLGVSMHSLYKWMKRRCQTVSNRSQFAAKYRNLCRTELAPLGESSGTVKLEIVSAVEGTFLIEMIADGGMNGGEFL